MGSLSEQSVINLPIEFQSKSHEALMNVWWTAMLLRKVSSRFFHEYLTSDAQFNILVLLKDSSTPLTQNDLSRKLLVDKSNITGLLDRLQKQKLIQRVPVEGDRRSYHVHLTRSGERLIARLDTLYTEKVHQIMSNLSDRECNDLIRLMRKVRSGIVADDES